MARRNEIKKVIGGHGDILSLKDLEAFNNFVEGKE